MRSPALAVLHSLLVNTVNSTSCQTSGSTDKPLPSVPPTPQVPSMNTANGSISQILNNVCEHCKIRPKYFDGTKLHSYCGRTCAQASIQLQSLGSQPQLALCVVCNLQPRYNDGTKVHQFCGKSCATKARRQRRTVTPKATIVNTGGPLCTIPGCQNPVYTDSNGKQTNYCSVKHKKLAEVACLWCKKAPKQVGHLCSRTCAQAARQASPCLLEIPEDHVTFTSVSEQFKTSWRHTNKICPPVRRVYKIIGTQASLDKYEAYRDAVEARGNFKAAGRSAGNENRRWHGTHRECNLGDQGHSQFCTSTSCSLCCIVKTTFDLSFFKKKTKWGRFGAGIYTSSTSSKSDDYADNGAQSGLKAILLNKVVVGNGCKKTVDDTTLTAPPAGYDSVLAEKGGTLNHDELVVYTNDAVRPSYLVMYDAI